MLGDADINIYAATFPYKQVFRIKDSEGNMINAVPKTSTIEVRQQLEEMGIKLVQGVMPLQDMRLLHNSKKCL
jgi:hypothetical protein